MYVFTRLGTGAWVYETSIENDDAKTNTLNKSTVGHLVVGLELSDMKETHGF